MDIIKQLNWRYATKQFDSSKKLTNDQLNLILEATNLSASSYGLQPYQIIVVENQEIREKLKDAAWGQPQLTDASQIIIFAAKTNLEDKDVDAFIQLVSEVRGVPVDSLVDYSSMMKGSMANLSNDEKTVWAAKQTYIALGQLLTTCALNNIDTCPMEGFNHEEFDNILGLKEKNLTSVVMAAVGFRSETDKYQHLPKVRKPINEMVITY
ncbi:NAD(P)H-dependent oxidoreductase [Carboxylicivirga linearis]|uniref:NAD(P)H-dependent oxidoreductase n=1 Tax=Carboxylicivirga linearis TaxID=1628157 RepID=A0ABS5JS04_9BACT|nr:NAD(P)H-dependent oxidoreductase [Carboxylicivirga linearis]MBS2097261.1 NAD(P)H-dependent oxidoreductase [Carboxylicivirga linearis]